MSQFERPPFRIALTADFYDAEGASKFADFGLGVFAGQSHIEVSRFPEHRPIIGADQLAGFHGVVVLTPRITQDSLADSGNLLAVCRFGVGYDTINVEACTDQDVLAMVTVGAVDWSMAEATVGWMLALTHHVCVKDRLVRTGRWDDRTRYMGCELRDRVLGVIGLGGIGRTLVTLCRGFGMRPPIAFDPFVSPVVMEALGVRSVELDELLTTADFVSVHCPLNDNTRGLIGPRELRLMKSGAFLLNTARGGIVEEDALFEALKERHIAGAAVDCFENEPLTQPHRFSELDNVILAPHSIGWTAEMFRDIGETACQCLLDLSLGKRPRGVLNPILFERESFRNKWSRVNGRSSLTRDN